MKPVDKMKSLTKSGLKKINDKLINPLTKILASVDSYLRKFDWRNDRNYAPERINVLHVQGHAKSVSYLLFFIPVFLIFGPSLGVREWVPAGIILILFGLLAFYLHYKVATERSLFLIQTGLLLVLSFILWFLAEPETKQRSQQIYQHLLIPLLWVLLGLMVLARFIAGWLLVKYKNSKSYTNYLKQVELFYSTKRSEPHVSGKAYIRSIFTAPFYHIIQLFYFPSLVVLVVADRSWMYLIASVVLVLTWLYLAASDVHSRLSMILEVLKGKLFIGAQLVISLIVIVLAIGRLLEFSYINTLIESNPNVVNLTLVFYIAAAYAFFWFFEYWINRPLLEQIINIFRDENDNKNLGRINYPAVYTSTSVKKEGRFMQTHGGARLAVVGVNKKNSKENWHTYQRVELFETIFNKLDMTDEAIIKDYHQYQSIKQRMRSYFLLINILLIGSFALITMNYMKLPQKPEVQTSSVKDSSQTQSLFNLNQRLFAVPYSGKKQEQAILLAASGGGTRAALYTESVLRGFKQNDLLKDLVLGSSVSGGSAALAYFAAHREALIKGEDDQWEKFSEVMGMPFIQDVLEGITEWRIIGGSEQTDKYTGQQVRMGMRLGDLLAESFEERFGLNIPGTNKLLGEQLDMGLIFNTAIVAQFPRWSCNDLGQHEKWKKCMCEPDTPISLREINCPELKTNMDQGGRLVFTNIDNLSGFPNIRLKDAPDEFLRYVSIQDGTVPLVRAAALSANFPPVFPNSAVDIDGQHRYWVTDGGASDNRGILSLLYALRGALKQELSVQKNASKVRSRPDIHVMIADASATKLSYTRGSGLDAKFGAPARFASQLMVDLASETESLYQQLGGVVKFHYLGMPLTLRSDGGLGTHWMLPANVSFNIPLGEVKSGNYDSCKKQSLSGVNTRNLIDHLHAAANEKYDSSKLSEQENIIWSWVCSDEYTRHQQIWREFILSVKGEDNVNPYCEKITENALCPR